jgi:hypothetical protein
LWDCHLKVHQFQKAEMVRPYPIKIIKFVPHKKSTASVLTLKALKQEAKQKGIKLPQLMKQYADKGYGWVDNNQRRKRKKE